MNPTRRGLLVSNLDRPVKSKSKQALGSSRARKSIPDSRPSAVKEKRAGDKALATKSEKSRQSVLEAAAKLFRQQGYSATTLRQIASMAEIKAGSIYYYFDSKEAILDEFRIGAGSALPSRRIWWRCWKPAISPRPIFESMASFPSA
jgi:AcrR family transcriptional regulator